MGVTGIVFDMILYLAATVAELLLAGWIGRQEKIFVFPKRRLVLLLAAGNMVLLLFAMYQESRGDYAAVWYFGLWTYLFCLGIYDLKYRELPDWWHLLPILLYAAAWLFGYRPVSVQSGLFTALVLAAVLGLVYVIRRDAIGLGDIKLILICAFYLGQACIGMLVRGMAAAFVCSIILLLCKKVTAKSSLPFVPFLLFGALFV